MDIKEAMIQRHAVRAFTDKAIEEKDAAQLQEKIEQLNKESGLHMQLCLDEPEAFAASQPHYGNFVNCRNYIALVGPKDADEACGYYGQQAVLTAQMLGINSCWVVLTFKKSKTVYKCGPNEKLYGVVALGYGQSQGTAHKSKPLTELGQCESAMPEWFKAGLQAAMLAPTAINQQKFLLTYKDGKVYAKTLFSLAGYTKMDLGIVKCQFEIGGGRSNVVWG